MAALPPYSRNDVVCVKCGHRGATTTYHEAPPPLTFGCSCWRQTADGVIDAGEHLLRTCQNCGYTWPEAVVPQPHEHDWDYEHPIPDLSDPFSRYARLAAPCRVPGCDARIAVEGTHRG